MLSELVMGLGQKFLTRVGSALWVWKFPLKIPKFLLFGSKKCHRVGSTGTQVKVGLDSYLLRVKSRLGLGRSGLISSQNQAQKETNDAEATPNGLNTSFF